MMTGVDHFYTTLETAQRLGYRQKTIELWARSHPGFATKVGRAGRQTWRISETTLRLVAGGTPVDELPNAA
jgi:hypothetical protein